MIRWLVVALYLLIANAVLADTLYDWRSVSVGAGGFAPNVIFSEAEPGLAYLRTDMGGIYRWDLKARRWLPLQDDMAESNYLGIESIAADPKDPEVVHAAAGMYKSQPAAMLRSFDRGNTWQITPVPFAMGGNEPGRGLGERLAIDPKDTRHLLFGSRFDGLWESTDQGASWHKVNTFPHPGMGHPNIRWASRGGLSFVVFATRSIFVGVADHRGTGIYRSRDGGKSWHKIAGGPALLPVQAAVGGNRLYVTYSDGIGPNGVNSGAMFTLDLNTEQWHDTTPPPQGAEGGFMGLSVNRQNPDRVAVATMNRWKKGDTIYLSNNGGQSWRELASRSRRDVSATPYLEWGDSEADFGWWIAGLAINPFNAQELVYTTGATVYRTQHADSDKLVWQPWVKGVEQTAIITLTSLPAGPELLSGFGDISGFAHTDLNRSPTHMLTNPLFANTNTIHYAPLAPNLVVRSGTPPHRAKGPVPTLAWSQDHGLSWQPVEVPALNLGLPGDPQRYDLTGNHAITLSADGDTFVFLAPEPQISRDRGKHWKPVKGLPPYARPVADQRDGQRFYALDFNTGEVYISRDGGANFTAQGTRGLPQNLSSERPRNREQAWPLLTSPDTSGALWLVTRQGLYQSRDSGKTFARVDSNLQVEQLSFGKAAPGNPYSTLFALGRRDGLRAVWRSDDQGHHWLRINDDQHQYGRRFRVISGDPRHYGRVYLGTDGRGILLGEPVAADTESPDRTTQD